jgi:hypothetical protein
VREEDRGRLLGAQTKFIRKLTVMILGFPGYDGYLPSRIFVSPIIKEKSSLPDILKGNFSKSDHS